MSTAMITDLARVRQHEMLREGEQRRLRATTRRSRTRTRTRRHLPWK